MELQEDTHEYRTAAAQSYGGFPAGRAAGLRTKNRTGGKRNCAECLGEWTGSGDSGARREASRCFRNSAASRRNDTAAGTAAVSRWFGCIKACQLKLLRSDVCCVAGWCTGGHGTGGYGSQSGASADDEDKRFAADQRESAKLTAVNLT
ncbi:hypothetical protein D3C77_461850 [compost metagenome]